MSVLVTIKVKGNVDQFRRFLHDGADRMRHISDAARKAGAIHHRFAIGSDFVLVVDEWKSEDAFHKFFQGTPELPGVMRDAGALAQPEFTIGEAVKSPDEF
jgi:hypothetical protein